MNLYVILLIIYLFDKLGYISYVENSVPFLKVGDESPEKLKQLERVAKKLMKNIGYRYSKEQTALNKIARKKQNFEDFTNSDIDEVKEAPKGMESKRLYNSAMKARAKYWTMKLAFEDEVFCKKPVSDAVCLTAFKDSFFKNEKLTYDTVNWVNSDGCYETPYLLLLADGKRVDFLLGYRTCLAKKQNDDGTEVWMNVYLQSAYEQPFLRKHRYFVIYQYLHNEVADQWEIVTEPSPENFKHVKNTETGLMESPVEKKIHEKDHFRYEAYLSFG